MKKIERYDTAEKCMRRNKMASLNKIYEGQILHDYHRYKMGNTNISKEGHWTVKVIEVIKMENKRGASCSWNGNKPEWYTERRIGQLRVNVKRKQS